MKKAELLESLDRATSRAATIAIQRGSPLQMTTKSTLIGNTFVEKNKNGFYDVLNFEKNTLYEDICVFDVAVIIAQRYTSHDTSTIKKVLHLEGRFSKYHTDMIHYLHCMKSAKKKNDVERMLILEDKFQIAEQFAKDTRDRISVFKRVK